MTKRKWISVDRNFKPLVPRKHQHPIDTVTKAVDHLVQILDGESRKTIRETLREELWQFWSWGAGIRKELGLWGQNTALLEELTSGERMHPDDASVLLMGAVWDRLQQQKKRKK